MCDSSAVTSLQGRPSTRAACVTTLSPKFWRVDFFINKKNIFYTYLFNNKCRIIVCFQNLFYTKILK